MSERWHALLKCCAPLKNKVADAHAECDHGLSSTHATEGLTAYVPETDEHAMCAPGKPVVGAHVKCNPGLYPMHALGIQPAAYVTGTDEHAMCPPDKPVSEAHMECDPCLSSMHTPEGLAEDVLEIYEHKIFVPEIAVPEAHAEYKPGRSSMQALGIKPAADVVETDEHVICAPD